MDNTQDEREFLIEIGATEAEEPQEVTPTDSQEPVAAESIPESNPNNSQAPETEAKKEQGGETQPVVIQLRDDMPPEPEPASIGETQIGGFGNSKELLEAYESLTTDYQTLKSSNPFADEKVKALNDFVAKGGDVETFLTVQSVDTATMSPIDKLVMAKKFKHPSIDVKVIRKGLEAEYKVPTDEFGDVDETQKQLIEDKLAFEAGLAEEYIKEHKVKSSVPDSEVKRQAQEKAESTRLESWDTPVRSVISSIKELELDLGDTKIKWPVKKEELASIQEQVQGLIQSTPGYDPTKENLANVREIAVGLYKAENFDNVLSALYKQLSTQEKTKAFNSQHNPSGAPGYQVKPEADHGLTADQMVDRMLGITE